MKLPCHAKLKDGRMCGARARSIIHFFPRCDRYAHHVAEAFLITKESVSPHDPERVGMLINFLAGLSFKEVAKKYGKTTWEVETIVREMM